MKTALFAVMALGLLHGVSGDACGGLLELQVAYEQRVKEVDAAHAAGMAKLDEGYAKALESLSVKAKQSGDLDKSLAVANEIQRFAADKLPTASSSGVPELRKLADTYREQAEKLGREQVGKILVLASAHDKALEQLERELVTSSDLEGAKAVRAEREAKAEALRKLAEIAGVRRDFTNSLGMRFVAVEITGGPTDGKNVLFSVWETRRRDYEAYANANEGVNGEWKAVRNSKGLPVGHEADHPVVKVSWEDAQAFCAWLTRVEREAKRIGMKDVYRLPSDHEWSCAVGIGADEDASVIPAKKSRVVKGYPWGTDRPPPAGAGNFDATLIEGYEDGFTTTAPVGSFKPGRNDLHDLSGNVWEWCEDMVDEKKVDRVLRGGSWGCWEVNLRSSHRVSTPPGNRADNSGFRCVLELSGG